MVLATRKPPRGLIHHSDCGSQYCAIDYQAMLRSHGVPISMSGKGNCYDNAVVEAFFKTIKSELVWPVAWQTRMRFVVRDSFHTSSSRHTSTPTN